LESGRRKEGSWRRWEEGRKQEKGERRAGFTLKAEKLE